MKDAFQAEHRFDELVPLAALLARPEIAVLADEVELVVEPVISSRRCSVTPRRVTIDNRLDEPAARVVLHFALEFALWGRLDTRPSPAAQAARLLAAAHATAIFSRLLWRGEAAALRWATPAWLSRLMAVATAPTLPIDLGRVLVDCAAFVDGPGDPSAAWDAYQALRPIALPAAALMLGDGDNRLDLDAATGLNKYGCSALPNPDVIALSSCTAADVSMHALHAAEDARRTIMMAMARGEARRAYAAMAASTRGDILSACGIADDGKVLPILAASGTTAILLAAHIGLGSGAGASPLAILVGPDESGRGVPLAASGRHPATRTPMGTDVPAGSPIEGFPSGYGVEAIAVRKADGLPAPSYDIVEAISASLARARDAGRPAVVHVLEGSKTGLASPGITGVVALRRRFPDVAVVVDACQMRMNARLLRDYLAAGCMVAITGSKFFGGPAFSGALLVPAAMLDRAGPMPSGLAGYSWSTDWPEGFAPARRGALTDAGNPGTLLRWQGALAEIDAFAALPQDAAAIVIDDFAATVRAAVADTRELAVLPGDDGGSIVSIALRRDADSPWLDEAALRQLYRRMGEDVCRTLEARHSDEDWRVARIICRIGQPVALADGPYPAVLRLAIGARGIAACARAGGMAAMHRQIAETIAKLRLLLTLD